MRNLDHLQPIVFRVINVIVACFMVIGGVATILTGGFPQFIRGIYCIIFGVIVGVFEFKLPQAVVRHVSFMFSFIGRGLFYIFIGCIILNYLPLGIASGIIVAAFGIAYVVCHFVAMVKPPTNMQFNAFKESEEPEGRPSTWVNSSQGPTNVQTPPTYHVGGEPQPDTVV